MACFSTLKRRPTKEPELWKNTAIFFTPNFRFHDWTNEMFARVASMKCLEDRRNCATFLPEKMSKLNG